jgi:hypothetical protein
MRRFARSVHVRYPVARSTHTLLRQRCAPFQNLQIYEHQRSKSVHYWNISAGTRRDARVGGGEERGQRWKAAMRVRGSLADAACPPGVSACLQSRSAPRRGDASAGGEEHEQRQRRPVHLRGSLADAA